MGERAYVVTRPVRESGLGSNLASMAGAWQLARRLGRDLVVDWRGMAFLKDESLNYFTEFFSELPELDGVRIHYAPSPEAGDHLAAGEDERRDISASEHANLVAAGSDALPRYLVLTRYHGLDRMGSDVARDYSRLRRFYQALELRPEVRAKADAFYDERLGGAFVVGINLATGNETSPTGRYYYGRFDARIFENRKRLLRRIELATALAVRRLPRELRDTRRVFFATESAWMAELLGRISASHARRTVFAPPETGRLFVDYEQLGYSDRAVAEDTVIDHFLLGRCDALVYNGSMFSQYARVLTNHFSGNCRNIDSLFATYWVTTAARRGRARLRRLRRA
jgi:hypothetical protein